MRAAVVRSGEEVMVRLTRPGRPRRTRVARRASRPASVCVGVTRLFASAQTVGLSRRVEPIGLTPPSKSVTRRRTRRSCPCMWRCLRLDRLDRISDSCTIKKAMPPNMGGGVVAILTDPCMVKLVRLAY